MSEDDVQYKLRLPAELHRNLADLAKKNGRSLSAEIISRLAASLVAGATDLHAADMKISMEIVRKEFEDEKRLARAQLLLAAHQDQAAMARHRLDRERRLVEHLQAQLDEASQHEDPTQDRIARELKDAQHWLAQVEAEYRFAQGNAADAMAELEHARQSLKSRAK